MHTSSVNTPPRLLEPACLGKQQWYVLAGGLLSVALAAILMSLLGLMYQFVPAAKWLDGIVSPINNLSPPLGWVGCVLLIFVFGGAAFLCVKQGQSAEKAKGMLETSLDARSDQERCPKSSEKTLKKILLSAEASRKPATVRKRSARPKKTPLILPSYSPFEVAFNVLTQISSPHITHKFNDLPKNGFLKLEITFRTDKKKKQHYHLACKDLKQLRQHFEDPNELSLLKSLSYPLMFHLSNQEGKEAFYFIENKNNLEKDLKNLFKNPRLAKLTPDT